MRYETYEAAAIRTVAVIGAGQAGRHFALRCALAGFSVVLEDVMPANLRTAQAEFADLSGRVHPGSMTFALTVEQAVREADIAIDFVPDELESKLEIFSLIDRMAPPKTILCTPSRALSITDLASCTYREDRCVAVQGDLAGEDEITLLYPRNVQGTIRPRVKSFFSMLRFPSSAQDDTSAPMLVKNTAAQMPR